MLSTVDDDYQSRIDQSSSRLPVQLTSFWKPVHPLCRCRKHLVLGKKGRWPTADSRLGANHLINSAVQQKWTLGTHKASIHRRKGQLRHSCDAFRFATSVVLSLARAFEETTHVLLPFEATPSALFWASWELVSHPKSTRSKNTSRIDYWQLTHHKVIHHIHPAYGVTSRHKTDLAHSAFSVGVSNKKLILFLHVDLDPFSSTRKRHFTHDENPIHRYYSAIFPALKHVFVALLAYFRHGLDDGIVVTPVFSLEYLVDFFLGTPVVISFLLHRVPDGCYRPAVVDVFAGSCPERREKGNLTIRRHEQLGREVHQPLAKRSGSVQAFENLRVIKFQSRPDASLAITA
ncbi:uncharacterized protein BT62DRAFT_1004356 [Guyanagaster necrorhizus]|uniref:Uncharacterized protein n=1 Tax=Guyanagaster necrorhizus TaxID=856835 RepID=A0A9P7VWT2_9AGAR|nr:uncharacterized protein BT62DRAFT_1004356 [Guyanagaster necrorhizus MCA 3950]KAG7447599.1 hypothetical protein BT62DRAFT_1004356 [Guyanagaster necrorhizus MCA 3950]